MATKKSKLFDKKLSDTETYMLIGAFAYDVFLFIISTIILIIINKSEDTISTTALKNAFCISLGFITTMMAIHSMKVTIDRAVSFNDEKLAKWHTIRVGIGRKIFLLLMLILIHNIFDIKYTLIFALSIMGIKFSAYLEPFISEKFGKSDSRSLDDIKQNDLSE